MSDTVKALELSLSPLLHQEGYDLVRLLLMGQSDRILQVMIERQDGGPILIGDCARVSRLVTQFLSHEDPIGGSYSIEVSSAGLDRPLHHHKDYLKYQGHPVVIKTHQSIGNQKRFEGILVKIEEDFIHLDLKTSSPASEGKALLPLVISFLNIKSARLNPFPTDSKPVKRG